ncbi:MAG: PfkB domain protein [Microbacteriaceae bacterium]|jgi:2-dehydro-3-deoxygluconokinase|nr:PfkB domain protein [Microbacteriaceae bacterium]
MVGDLPTAHIEVSSLLHVTGITAGISAATAEAVHFAIAVARDAGVPVSFDLNYRSHSEARAGRGGLRTHHRVGGYRVRR